MLPSFGFTATEYKAALIRLSLVGSTAWLGSTYSPRLPSPLVSRMSAVQPCDFCSSPVSSNIFRFSQPMTPLWGPPALVHSVLSASSANTRWCVGKHVLISVIFPVFGSYMERWRLDWSTGNSLADGRSEERRVGKEG